MELVHTEEGNATVDTFLQWLVINTKQSLRFHVVLTSSDPYFESWQSGIVLVKGIELLYF